MSVDAAAERAALEAKDRDELQQIISALGGKVTSRTRKPTMIDTILELTGVVPASGDANASAAPSENGSADDATADSTDDASAEAAAPAVEEPATDDASDDAKSGDAKDSQSDDSGSSSGRQRGGQRDGQGGGQRGGQRDGQGGGQSGGQRRNEQSGSGESKQNPGNQGKPGQDKQGQDNQGQGKQGNGQNKQAESDDASTDTDDDNGDDEAGNKRRRRRGRNRDGNQPQQEEFTGDPIPVAGYLDLRHDGYGFLRVQGFLPSRQDVYVSVKQTRQFGLRDGDHIEGGSRPAFRNEKNPAMLRIDKVNGGQPEAARERPRFAELTSVFPDERITLESPTDNTRVTARLIDILCPIGKGQRGLVLSPPKSGKTSVFVDIARAITENDPEIAVLLVLVDERPEEVIEVQRAVPAAEVVASTFDRPADEHTRMVELVLSRAERMVESGKDVVVLIDGITRLVRAYNTTIQSSGKTLPGGLDLAALHPAKKLFGAARNAEEGGSLTMLATLAAETGSVLDTTIAEEFAGTANMELKLDRHMATRRVHPAIDIAASSTRQEAQLIPVDQLTQVETLRRVLAELPDAGAASDAGRPLERLIDRLVASADNETFLNDIANDPTL